MNYGVKQVLKKVLTEGTTIVIGCGVLRVEFLLFVRAANPDTASTVKS